MTNEQKIKAMSTEELAEFLRSNDIDCECCKYQYEDCRRRKCLEGITEWLKEEAEE